MELSRTAYVILGALSLGARTGYDVKGLVDHSTRFFWATSYGQIYPELARLEEQGLIEGAEDPAGGRQRRAFILTAAGREALREWLSADEQPRVEIRHEGALKLFFSDLLPRDGQVEQLERVAAEHDRIVAQLQALRPGAAAKEAGRDKRLPLLTLEWGLALHEFNAEWCRAAAQRLRESDADEGS